jgi:hypothetical protein
MPRENISGGHGARIEVTWRKGVWAQVGVCQDTEIGGPDLKNVEDGYGIWADLDLDSITRLQKVLRRVKRQLQEEPDPIDA